MKMSLSNLASFGNHFIWAQWLCLIPAHRKAEIRKERNRCVPERWTTITLSYFIFIN